MADYRAALAISAARPVAAGRIVRPSNGRAILLSTGEYIVSVWCIAAAIDRHSLLVERALLVNLVVAAVQVGHIGSDLHAFRIGPWTVADPVLGVDPARALRREICAPRLAARASGLGRCTDRSRKQVNRRVRKAGAHLRRP